MIRPVSFCSDDCRPVIVQKQRQVDNRRGFSRVRWAEWLWRQVFDGIERSVEVLSKEEW